MDSVVVGDDDGAQPPAIGRPSVALRPHSGEGMGERKPSRVALIVSMLKRNVVGSHKPLINPVKKVTKSNPLTVFLRALNVDTKTDATNA